jgi:hypothetical protein
MGIVRSGHAGTIGLEKCDRRAGGAVLRTRAAAFGRFRSCAAARISLDPDECFVANAIASPELAGRSGSVECDRPAASAGTAPSGR